MKVVSSCNLLLISGYLVVNTSCLVITSGYLITTAGYFLLLLVTSFYFWLLLVTSDTAQRMKFSIKDFFSKCDQIDRKLQIWSHLLKKSLMENFIFGAVFQ